MAVEDTESISPLKSTLYSSFANREANTLEFIQGKDRMKIYQANVGTKAKPRKRYVFSATASDE